jgi:hypothetical protein
MPINRTNTSAIGVGTALNNLASSTTACAATGTVSSSTSNNLTGITARWNIAVGVISPTASTVVNVFVWGTNDETTRPGYQAGATEVIPASAGAITLSANGQAGLRFLKSTLCHTASQTVSDEADVIAALGFIPRRWGLVVQNQTGAALASSGHSAESEETYYN